MLMCGCADVLMCRCAQADVPSSISASSTAKPA
jgi:hypothetical protein